MLIAAMVVSTATACGGHIKGYPAGPWQRVHATVRVLDDAKAGLDRTIWLVTAAARKQEKYCENLDRTMRTARGLEKLGIDERHFALASLTVRDTFGGTTWWGGRLRDEVAPTASGPTAPVAS
jgi:hypothetical protein